MSKRSWYGIILVILFFVLTLLPPVSQRLYTFSVMLNLMVPADLWRPLDLFTKKSLEEDLVIESLSGREIRLRTYYPARINSKEQLTGLIIYTPFIREGIDDIRLVNMSRAFSRAGFIVVTPGYDEPLSVIGVEDRQDMVTAINFTYERLAVDRLGVFGISYGNGPAITAAADERVLGDIDFVISFSGFFDLRHFAEFVITGEYSYQDITESLEPHEFTKEIMREMVAIYETDMENFIDTAEFEELRTSLSPSEVVHDLPQVDFFIIHSLEDDMIPFTESLHLRNAVRVNRQVEFLLTDVVEHGAYRPPTPANIVRIYIPALRDFYAMIYQLLNHYP